LVAFLTKKRYNIRMLPSDHSERAMRRAYWHLLLREQGHRLTSGRLAVVDCLLSSERVLTAQDIFEQARHDHSDLGLVSVYRTLETLEELGLVERVHQAQGCHAYIAVAGGHRHLLLCEQCGRATHFAGDELEALMRLVENQTQYRIHQHWLQLSGVCPQCQRSGT